MKRKVAFLLIICLALSVGIFFKVPSVGAYSTSYVYPEADAMVLNVTADTNYGGNPTNTLGFYYGEIREGFFQFNMSDFDPDLGTYENITILDMYFEVYSDFYYDYREGDNFFRLAFTNASWVENTITWNTKPSYTNTSEITRVNGQDDYFSWDLREISNDFLLAIEQDDHITTVLIAYGETQCFNARFKEYGGISYDPRIRIDYVIATVGEIYEREPSLATFPTALGEALSIGQFGGELLASLIVILMFMLPTAYATRNHKSAEIVIIMVGLPLFGLLVAISYLPVWSLLLLVMALAMLYANKITGFFKK